MSGVDQVVSEIFDLTLNKQLNKVATQMLYLLNNRKIYNRQFKYKTPSFRPELFPKGYAKLLQSVSFPLMFNYT